MSDGLSAVAHAYMCVAIWPGWLLGDFCQSKNAFG